MAQVGSIDDEQNFLDLLGVIILPHHRNLAAQLPHRDALLGCLSLRLLGVVTDGVEVGSDGVDRVRREVDAARVLDAVEKHRLASIPRPNTQIRHDKAKTS